MAVKVRLRRVEQKETSLYRIIVANPRSPRDGKFIEEIGAYGSIREPSVIRFGEETAKKWLTIGAQPTETVGKLLKIADIQ